MDCGNSLLPYLAENFPAEPAEDWLMLTTLERRILKLTNRE
jgi:hypothetical protein